MLDEDPAVAADVEYMFKFRSTTEGVLAFSRDITCLLQQAKRAPVMIKLSWMIF